MRYRISKTLLAETFDILRQCGEGRRECQALWVSAWHDPANIALVVHPQHRASAVGFENDNGWFNEFWLALAAEKQGIRVQIHTHPGGAYHSATDDAYPVIHQPGFLSLVIPRFAQGPIGFDGAYLAEIGPDGNWHEAIISDQLEVT